MNYVENNVAYSDLFYFFSEITLSFFHVLGTYGSFISKRQKT